MVIGANGCCVVAAGAAVDCRGDFAFETKNGALASSAIADERKTIRVKRPFEICTTVRIANSLGMLRFVNGPAPLKRDGLAPQGIVIHMDGEAGRSECRSRLFAFSCSRCSGVSTLCACFLAAR